MNDMFGRGEIIIIVVIAVLVLFGGKKIPELMRGLGSGLREFKDSVRGINPDEQDSESKKIPEARANSDNNKNSDEKS